MGRETRPDLALDIKVMFRVMELLEDNWRTTLDEEERRFLSFTGLFLIVGLLAGLRGCDLMFMNLTGSFSNRKKGRGHPVVPHAVVTLLCCFKGLIGDRFHGISLPLITKSGFTPAPWID